MTLYNCSDIFATLGSYLTVFLGLRLIPLAYLHQLAYMDSHIHLWHQMERISRARVDQMTLDSLS